jgi:hypothetical protein
MIEILKIAIIVAFGIIAAFIFIGYCFYRFENDFKEYYKKQK